VSCVCIILKLKNDHHSLENQNIVKNVHGNILFYTYVLDFCSLKK